MCAVRYQSESAELNQWLQEALERLEFWSTQSVTVPVDVETVRDHLSAFLVSTNLLPYLNIILFGSLNLAC